MLKKEPFAIINLFVFTLIFSTSFSSKAQNFLSESLIAEKFEHYRKANPNQILFVHTDKTIYTNNETIWFSGYLIDRSDKALLAKHTILSAFLIREDNREVISQENYMMNNGFSFGSLALSDSIPPGNYQLFAGTNLLDTAGKPLAIFRQPITIKSITQPAFNALLSLIDTVPVNGILRAKITASPELTGQRSKERFTIDYSIGNSVKNQVSLKPDESSFLISIPAEALRAPDPVLLSTVKYGREIQHLSLKLPEITATGINVRFFPEGGNMVNEVESIVAWEALTAKGLPLNISATLLRDGQPVDTIRTTAYGIGSFKLRPNNGSRYTLAIKANNYLKKNTVYELPQAVNEGIVLHLDRAVVNDTLSLSLSGKKQRAMQVIIHTNNKALAVFRLNANPLGSKVAIALPGMAKGIGSITVLDELGRPVAERLFFAHFNQKNKAVISTDKESYNRKEKVSVKIKLSDQDDLPVRGIVSLAAVQVNRIEGDKFQDITTYTYLESSIGKIPRDPMDKGFDNRDYIEDILLVKGWREYTWQKLMNSTVKDLMVTAAPELTGRVMHSGKPLKKPLDIVIIKDSLTQLSTTRLDGSFTLTPNQLAIEYGRKVTASVNQNNKLGYTIEMNNPFASAAEVLKQNLQMTRVALAQSVQSTSDNQITGLNRIIALKEVVVKENSADGAFLGLGGADPCGDFICPNGFFNCPNHYYNPKNTAPVPGKKYEKLRMDADDKVEVIYYSGCAESKPDIFNLKPIYTARQFYGINQNPESLSMPQFISTLAWKPGIVTNENGVAEFDFYTGDITSNFKIIVQGISPQGVLSGQTEFVVK